MLDVKRQRFHIRYSSESFQRAVARTALNTFPRGWRTPRLRQLQRVERPQLQQLERRQPERQHRHLPPDDVCTQKTIPLNRL